MISVCIPAYNEEAVIAETVAEATETLSRIPGQHEILVCDDGSSDRTGAILAELAPTNPLLRVLVHERNRGHPAALETLVNAAEGKYLFHIGADREWKMDEMIPMLAELEAGADIVVGVRRNKQYTPWRKLVSSGFNLLVAILWGKHFGDIGSLKMARARVWKPIPFRAGSAFVNAERLLLAYQAGARIAQVPVEHFARTAGKSSYASPRKAVDALVDLLKFRLETLGRRRG